MTRPRKKPLGHSTCLKELIEVAAKSGSVSLNLFVQDEDWVAIEGDRESLVFLGNLLLMFAKGDGPNFLNLDNSCPVFKAGSEGIILYRKP